MKRDEDGDSLVDRADTERDGRAGTERADRADMNRRVSPLPDVVTAQRVAALYRKPLPGFIVTLAVATITAAVIMRTADRVALEAWLVAVLLIAALRFALVWAYRRRERSSVEAPAWERRFAIGAAAMGIAWGALPFLTVDATYTVEVFVAFVLGGMAIGAMGVLSSSRIAYLLFAVPMLGAFALWSLYQGDEVHAAMALLVVVFLAAVVRVFHELHRSVVQNIAGSIANDRLRAEQRSLFDATTVGLAFVRDRDLVACNQQFEHIFGWTYAELVSDARPNFPDDVTWRGVVREAYTRAAAGETLRGELELVRKDSRFIWCEVSGRSIIAGQPELGLVLSFADITERKHAEAALRGSEERLDLVVRASQGGLWDWNIGRNESYFSPRFKEILHYPGDAEFATHGFFEDRVHPEDGDQVAAVWEKASAEPGAPFDCEFRIRCADASYVWVHARGMVLFDLAERPVRAIGSIIDISDRKAIESRLRESEQYFRYLVEAANDLVWAVDHEGRWTYLSPRATRQIFGWEPDQLLRQRFIESQPEGERERTLAMLRDVVAGGTASHFETRHINHRGDEIVLSLNATPMRTATGAIIGVTGTATDITELKLKEGELSWALAEQQLIFDAVSEGIVFLKRRIVHKCNRKFAEMLGYEPEALIGQPSLIWHANEVEWEQFGRESRAVLEAGESYQTELLVRRKDGHTLWCDIRGSAVDARRLDEDGTIFVYIDISARKEREQRIQHLADHDALTGLLNRRLLEDRMQQAINLARRNGSLVGVMLIDLDGFKDVNDQYGHLMGDYVLRTVANRLSDCVRESDTVARLGGDEFVVLLTGQRSADDSTVVAEKILAVFAEPVVAGGRRFMIGASIGISVFPRDGATPGGLLKHADTAMYRVKEAGKNRFAFYSS